MSPPLQQNVARYADEIEGEMRSQGLWQDQPLRAAQLNFKQAFGMDTMTFTQWLQFVFLPRVREAVAANQFPRSSSVGAQAVREFDGNPDADRLVTLLEASPLMSKRDSLIAPGRLEDWNRMSRTFDSITGFYSENVTDTSGPEP